MKERPILFSTDMVRELREDRKTQTRRTRGLDAINAEPDEWQLLSPDAKTPWRSEPEANIWRFEAKANGTTRLIDQVYGEKCPYGIAGDKIWTREAFAIHNVTASEYGIGYRADHQTGNLSETDGGYNFRYFSEFEPELSRQREWAEKNRGSERWKPSLFLPRWASRDTMELVSVRPERLQDICYADVMAEGVPPVPCLDGNMSTEDITDIARSVYGRLWESINGDGAWTSNPWVWRIEFRRENRLS